MMNVESLFDRVGVGFCVRIGSNLGPPFPNLNFIRRNYNQSHSQHPRAPGFNDPMLLDQFVLPDVIDGDTITYPASPATSDTAD